MDQQALLRDLTLTLRAMGVARSHAAKTATALLPSVLRFVAEELRAAAAADDAKPIRWPGASGEWLRARADALAITQNKETAR